MLSLQFSPFPALETERLLLQQITPGDAAALFEMRSDKEIMKYIDRPLAQTVDDALALIQVITDALQKNEGITWG
ncbi:MAG TPA: GNAT family N-acetyltransferase, partial [Flavisolibacter sp.]|nr:GNAT family N-acetyltransferase [Flavisolibacter sp.]